MPRGDRTGPDGRGPMTGRGLGYCVGNDRPGFMEPGYGKGYGRGLGRGFGRGSARGAGRGRGFGRGIGFRGDYYDSADPYESREPTAGEEKEYLESEKNYLQKALDAIKKKLEKL